MADVLEGVSAGGVAAERDLRHAELLAFVAAHILPHESALRGWLARLGVKSGERDDIVQEVYCRLLRLDAVAHITEPRAYLFRSARNVVLEQARRNRVVSITTMQNIDELGMADSGPDPEAATSVRAELKRALGLIARLPERCRRVFEMRKIHGLSQMETARALHVSENIVEKETARGLSLVLRYLGEAGHVAD
ncbi:RNA polymerase sigma factor [Asticcacaulis sp. EMRT-3]|uniref:RNA polymerase sigma factor n=1 Tax=Asticcacaulis sp. EMRT-3 TaxID=3040349 RepID=UPI0024AFF457|nr:RNA polymerase sigma factor [Asticcacaulis sp. EMRT-3]MDI7775861.1 RNA polymerase sigma factor [Asticcacaulis sp. EMRT-3]